MSNSLSKWFAALLAVILLYLVPAAESARRQDDLSRFIVYQSLTKFVDSVRTKGYISPMMYEEFVRSIETTGNMYEVQMEHQHKKYHPYYLDPSNPSTFQDSYTVEYDGYYHSDLMRIMFPGTELSKEDPSRLYKMSVGDYFLVHVQSLNKTPFMLLSDALTFSDSSGKHAIAVPYGGMIINEDY